MKTNKLAYKEYNKNDKSRKQSILELILLIFFILVIVTFYRFEIFGKIIFPIKVLVVSLHEFSHGIAAELVGGDIVDIEVNFNLGGKCTYMISSTSKAAQIFVTSAGYLGSLLWGCLIFLMARNKKLHKPLFILLSAIMLILIWYMIMASSWPGILFAAGFIIFMAICFLFIPPDANENILKFIGLTSCAYVLTDISGDLIFNTFGSSDSTKIASIMFGSRSESTIEVASIIIGIIWLIIALAIIFFMLYYSFKKIRDDLSNNKTDTLKMSKL